MIKDILTNDMQEWLDSAGMLSIDSFTRIPDKVVGLTQNEVKILLNKHTKMQQLPEDLFYIKFPKRIFVFHFINELHKIAMVGVFIHSKNGKQIDEVSKEYTDAMTAAQITKRKSQARWNHYDVH